MSKVITFFETKDWENEEYLRRLKSKLGERFFDYDIEFVPYPLRKNTAKDHQVTEIAIVYLNSLVDNEVLDQMKNLKFIITRTTGYEHIDVLACNRRGIRFTNIPAYASMTVAEYAIALMFALARRLRVAIMKMKNLDFSREGLMGFDLYGKVAGIIGTGSIGSHICRIAYGIGMKVLGYDIKPDTKLEELYKISYVSLNYLLENSDVIFVAVPYSPETHHMINNENIKLTKDKAMLINIARGPIVDTSAIIWAMNNEKLQGGIALDVFEGEKILTEATYLTETEPSEELCRVLNKALMTVYLYRYHHFILTPHVAYYTEEAIERLIESVIDEIYNFLRYKLSSSGVSEFF